LPLPERRDGGGVNYPPVLTWPIAFAVWAVLLGLAWAVARRRRARAATRPAARMVPRTEDSQSAVVHDETTEHAAFDSAYVISPAPDVEGGEYE
jgi:hypothetical protein